MKLRRLIAPPALLLRDAVLSNPKNKSAARNFRAALR
jgi:hypothetical protein